MMTGLSRPKPKKFIQGRCHSPFPKNNSSPHSNHAMPKAATWYLNVFTCKPDDSVVLSDEGGKYPDVYCEFKDERPRRRFPVRLAGDHPLQPTGSLSNAILSAAPSHLFPVCLPPTCIAFHIRLLMCGICM